MNCFFKYLLGFAIVRRLFWWLLPPKPVTNLKWEIESMTEKHAQVRLFWTPSPSKDVKRVLIEVVADNFVIAQSELPPSANEYILNIPENAIVDVVIGVDDGTYVVPASFTFTVPDLTKPLPVTDIGFEILGVIDVEVEEPEPVEE